MAEWKQSLTPLYIWVGFRKTKHAQDQQNSVAYGQWNNLTGASSRFIPIKHIFTKYNISYTNVSVLLFAVAIWPVTGQDLQNTKRLAVWYFKNFY